MKIKSTIVVAAAAGSAFAPAAKAADMPVKGPRVTPAPTWSWTGFYAGGHRGYAWQRNATSGAYLDGAVLRPFDHAYDPKGFMGGAQIGYNWQTGRIVFGLEADISSLSSSGSVTTVVVPNVATVTSSNRIRWMGTVRGRLGVAAAERTMIFATGGLAYGGLRHDHMSNEDGAIANWRASKTKVGYAIGGGVEHAVHKNVSVRLEGLYVDFGKTTMNSPTSGVCDTACQPVTFKNNATIVRGGVNVHF
jgi:outer membrane immunogenic protein